MLIADNPRHLRLFSGRGGGGHFLSCIFVGHAYKISLPLSGSLSPHVFLGAGQSRRRAEFASVVFRSCILSHGIPDRSPYIHTLWWVFFFLSLSLCILSFLFCLRGQRTTKSLVATFRLSNLFQPVRRANRV